MYPKIWILQAASEIVKLIKPSGEIKYGKMHS